MSLCAYFSLIMWKFSFLRYLQPLFYCGMICDRGLFPFLISESYLILI